MDVVDPVIRNYEQYMNEWTYRSHGIYAQTDKKRSTHFGTELELDHHPYYRVVAFQPSELMDSYIVPDYHNKSTSLGLTERLYTASGC